MKIISQWAFLTAFCICCKVVLIPHRGLPEWVSCVKMNPFSLELNFEFGSELNLKFNPEL